MLALLLAACTPATVTIGTLEEIGDTATPDSGDGRETGGLSDPDTAWDTADTGGGETAEDTGAPAEAEWTLLLFLNGDNDLEQWAVGDLEEMEQVGSTDRVNVIVQIDRSTSFYRGAEDWSGARRYRAEAHPDDGIGSPVLEDLGAIDSGDAQTIVDFVAWGVERYPARRYALVLWDHGDGWSIAPADPTTKAVSYDYGSGSDISVAEGDLADVLEGSTAAIGRPLDLLGMDACTMQSWEIAWVAQPFAEIYVASQDYEDVDGWAYDTTLADLAAEPTMDAAALGATIARRFAEIPDSTLSVLDLTRMGALDAALEDLAASAIASGGARDLLDAAGEAQGFDGRSSTNHDLADALGKFEEVTGDQAVAGAIADVRAALGDLVLVNHNQGGAVSDALGISIYTPSNGRVPGIYADAAWSQATSWDEFLEAGQ